MKIKQKISDYLKNRPQQQFTCSQIAEWIINNYPDEYHKKAKNHKNNRRTPKSQLTSEIGTALIKLKKDYHNEFKDTADKPKKFYFCSKNEKTPNLNNESHVLTNTKTNITEHELYPILTQYLKSEFNIYSKRIDEKRSPNSRGKNGNKWLYPDIVGMQNLSSNWNNEIKVCVDAYFDKKTKIWSFEVKKSLDNSTIRQSFFQTVSNSSWANLSYLVAKDIDHKSWSELLILTGLHGIGVIELNVDDPKNSQIIIPAKERSEVDWNTASRLSANKDFKSFIQLISQFYKANRLDDKDWDLDKS